MLERTFLGLSICLCLLLSVSFAPSAMGGIDRVQVSNLTSAAATITWTTTEATNGCVNFGETTPPGDTECDPRPIDFTHEVILAGLSAETLYHFEVASGVEVDDNGGAYYSFTTTPAGAGDPHVVFGDVQVDAGAFAPAAGVIVSLTASTSSGTSHPLTDLTDASGLWSINLGNLKNVADGTVLGFAPGDTLFIDAEGAAAGTGADTITVGSSTPQNAGTITISADTPDELCCDLTSGWNWFSTNIDPAAPCNEPESIFAACAGDVNIVKARNGSFWLPGIFDGIGCMNPLENYAVHLNNPCTVCVQGTPLAPDIAIPLDQGWNWIPYLPNQCGTPELLLASIWDDTEIVKARDGSFCLPYIYCGISQMCPCDGFRIYVTQACTLSYVPPTLNAPPPLAAAPESPAHFHPTGATDNYQAILVRSATLAGRPLGSGDEIALFANDRCLGAGVWNENQPLAIAAWADDPRTDGVDGYRPGDSMEFRIWDKSEKRELRATAQFSQGHEIFQNEPLVAVDLAVSATGVAGASGIPLFDLDSEPNPATMSTTIRFFLPEESAAALRVYTVSGRLVRELLNDHVAAGPHSLRWDTRDGEGRGVSDGVYFYRLESAGRSITRKLVIIR